MNRLDLPAVSSRLEAAYRSVRDTIAERRASESESRCSRVSSGAGACTSGQFDAEEFEANTGMTPDEYVVQCLEEEEGRIRQQALVERLCWSDATVSRLLQSLDQEGTVRIRKLGRENVVCLPTTDGDDQ